MNTLTLFIKPPCQKDQVIRNSFFNFNLALANLNERGLLFKLSEDILMRVASNQNNANSEEVNLDGPLCGKN